MKISFFLKKFCILGMASVGVMSFAVSSVAAAPFDPGFCNTVTAIPVSECSVLENFYNTFNGSGWTLNGVNSWGVDTNAANWRGLVITNGRASEILLTASHLSGSISNFSFSGLTQLTRISTASNNISGNLL